METNAAAVQPRPPGGKPPAASSGGRAPGGQGVGTKPTGPMIYTVQKGADSLPSRKR